jgi:uncharacterized glyoxalase superfamily protein PhnB
MPDNRSFFTGLRYNDAPAAMDWLMCVFGFEKLEEHAGPNGSVAFAVMGLDGDVLGTGTARPDVHHVVAGYVDDPDAHYEQARRAGAQITQTLQDTDFDARIYAAHDPAGNLWSFGTHRQEQKTSSVIFPCFRYDDARQAMRWLTRAFGLKEEVAYEDQGVVLHAEMSFGSSGIMLGSAREPDAANPWSTAAFGIYVYVEDVASHYALAKAAGAEIVREMKDTDYGAREFSLLDLEGNLWSLDDYMPEWMKKEA